MKTPNITQAQLLAVIAAVCGLLIAFGVPLSQAKQDAIVHLVEVITPVIVAADAVIRAVRAHNITAIAQAKKDDASKDVPA